MSDKPAPNGVKILLINPDDSVKQLSTDTNGNLNVNAAGMRLSKLTDPPAGQVITAVKFNYNEDGTVATEIFLNGVTELFTLTFSYYENGLVDNIVRTEGGGPT